MFGDQMTLKCIVTDADNYNSTSATDLVISDKTFTMFDYNTNRATYVSDDHKPDQRDLLQLSRTLPTVNGNYRGSYKNAIKATLDVPVLGRDGTSQIMSPVIINLETSIPVGTPAHVIRNMIYQHIAVLAGYVGGESGGDFATVAAYDNERLAKINAFFTSQVFAG